MNTIGDNHPVIFQSCSLFDAVTIIKYSHITIGMKFNICADSGSEPINAAIKKMQRKFIIFLKKKMLPFILPNGKKYAGKLSNIKEMKEFSQLKPVLDK